jgi:hypothetical protein
LPIMHAAANLTMVSICHITGRLVDPPLETTDAFHWEKRGRRRRRRRRFFWGGTVAVANDAYIGHSPRRDLEGGGGGDDAHPRRLGRIAGHPGRPGGVRRRGGGLNQNTTNASSVAGNIKLAIGS